MDADAEVVAELFEGDDDEVPLLPHAASSRASETGATRNRRRVDMRTTTDETGKRMAPSTEQFHPYCWR
jgi:hypothetical protein